jgi:microcystin-dependent protein
LDQPFLGQLAVFPYSYAPKHWAPCDGQLLHIHEHTALYSLIGTKFGGDGTHNFALPKLPGPAPELRYFIALLGNFPPHPQS